MILRFSCAFFLLLGMNVFAVNDTIASDTTIVENEEISYWTNTNQVGLNVNEVAFVNWSAGGNNSISGLFFANATRKFQKDLMIWNNKIAVKYGLNAQEGRELAKTEDHVEIISEFGYRKDSISNWYYFAKFNFHTQFTNGYKNPDADEQPISGFMAPGYAFIGVGTEFSHPTKDFKAYISPVTEKSTFVLNQALANQGMFGVTPAVVDEEGNIIKEGENVRTQFGFLFTSSYSTQVVENVGLNNQLRLYSDYLNKFGNIDVDWELNLKLKVNEYVQASIGSHLKYDDDVKFKEDVDGDGELETTGPRVQFKQLLGIGMVYQF